jgi:glycosyltransferase involved in cell wall biosynthesis
VAKTARRNIIWILDLIAAHIVEYSSNYANFNRLRDSLEASIQRADGVAVLSPHVRRDLESFSRFAVTDKVFELPNGVPRINPSLLKELSGVREREGDRNLEIEEVLDAEFVLVLGTAFWHKNRTWFLRLMKIVSSLGWDGQVVVAGPLVARGESSLNDREVMGSRESGRVTFYDWVTDIDRMRLLSRARLVVTPSISEGWGMLPLEALVMGSVPLSTLGGGLYDITPATAEFLTLANDDADARTVHGLLTNNGKRAAQVAAWSSVDWPTWSEAADTLVRHMFIAISRPRALSAPHKSRLDQKMVQSKRIRTIIETISPRGTKRRKIVAFVARALRGLRVIATR